MKEFAVDLVDLKKRFDKTDSLVLDSRGGFPGQANFGDCGVFIILKHVDQPLKYVTFDIDQKSKAKNPKKKSKKEKKKSDRSISKESSNQIILMNETSKTMSQASTKIQRKSMDQRGSIEDYNIYNQSLMTTNSRQLHVVNEIKRNEMFGFSEVLYQWSGEVCSNLLQPEMLFAKSLLNMPLGNQTSKDHGVLALIQEVLGTKEMFLGWDLSNPFEFAEIPNTFILEIFKIDFDYFFYSLRQGAHIMGKVQRRIAKGSLLTQDKQIKKHLSMNQFDNSFDYFIALIDWFASVHENTKEDIKINDREKKEIQNSKNVLSNFKKKQSFFSFADTNPETIYDKLDKIYFHKKTEKDLNKDKYKRVEQKVRVNRVNQIESEYLLYKNKTQNEALLSQLARIINRVWSDCPLNEQRKKLALSILRFFEKNIGDEGLYFFLVGQVMFAHLGTNWMGLPAERLRQALFALSFNFLGQELSDNFLLNLVHLLVKSFSKYLVDSKIGEDELILVQKINEFEQIRDEEIMFQSNRINELIEKEMKNRSRPKSFFFDSSHKLNRSLQSFNISSRSNKSGMFRISGKNQTVLKYKKMKKKIIKGIKLQCEESLRFQYFNYARQWKMDDVSSKFDTSIFAKLLQKNNFYLQLQEILKNIKFSIFLIFKNVFIINILHFFYVKPEGNTVEESKTRQIPKHHHFSYIKREVTSRVGGWPFEVNMNGLKSVRKLGKNVIKNLIQGYQRPTEENKSVFFKLIDMVGKYISEKKEEEIEIKVDGRDIQSMLDIIRAREMNGHQRIWPMVKAFPRDLALTDIFFNQIGLDTQESMPYFLHVEHFYEKGLIGRVVDIEVFYRVDSRFGTLKNNYGNRVYLENVKKDIYGINGRKCGRKGCQEQVSKRIKIKEYTLKEVRKRLNILSENFVNIPSGKLVFFY